MVMWEYTIKYLADECALDLSGTMRKITTILVPSWWLLAVRPPKQHAIIENEEFWRSCIGHGGEVCVELGFEVIMRRSCPAPSLSRRLSTSSDLASA